MKRPFKPNTLVLIKQDGEPTFRLVMKDPGKEDYIEVYDPFLEVGRNLHISRITPLCETSGPYNKSPRKVLEENRKIAINSLALALFKLRDDLHTLSN